MDHVNGGRELPGELTVLLVQGWWVLHCRASSEVATMVERERFRTELALTRLIHFVDLVLPQMIPYKNPGRVLDTLPCPYLNLWK